jgi:hypothetical protein
VPCLLVNAFNFLTLIGIGTYVLVKIRFRLDISAVITLALYTLCISMRTSQWVIFVIRDHRPDQSTPYMVFALSVVNSIAERIKWFIMYFFILEMQEVKIKLESSSIDSYRDNRKKHIIHKWLIYGLCFVLSSFILVFSIVRNYNSMLDTGSGSYNLPEPWLTIMVLLRTLTCCLNIFMFVVFLQVFLFFKRTKLAKYF